MSVSAHRSGCRSLEPTIRRHQHVDVDVVPALCSADRQVTHLKVDERKSVIYSAFEWCYLLLLNPRVLVRGLWLTTVCTIRTPMRHPRKKQGNHSSSQFKHYLENLDSSLRHFRRLSLPLRTFHRISGTVLSDRKNQKRSTCEASSKINLGSIEWNSSSESEQQTALSFRAEVLTRISLQKD